VDDYCYPTNRMVLPLDGQWSSCHGGSSVKRATFVPEWRRRFASPYVKPKTAEDAAAWFRWCVGHHHLFLFWGTASYAFHRVVEAVKAGEADKAADWLNRAARLVRGSVGAMVNAAGFEPELYKEFLRPSMERCRPDFAAGSSKEHALMMIAFQNAKDAMKDAGFLVPAVQRASVPCALLAANTAINRVMSTWLAEHHQIVACFVGKKAPSLLDQVLRRQLSEMDENTNSLNKDAYIRNVIRSPEAQADYDRYFGVTRAPVGLEDLADILIHVLDGVYGHLAPQVTPKHRVWMAAGDSMMHSIVAELLDGSSLDLAA
jgi:hypothetical protein